MASIERLSLDTLAAGESVTMVAGSQPDAYQYIFTIERPGETPLCDLTQISPDGSSIGPGKAILQGCGRWTTESQNPMQRADWFTGRPRQDVAMLIGYGLLFVGGLIVVCDPNDLSGNRLQLQPACTAILRGKPDSMRR